MVFLLLFFSDVTGPEKKFYANQHLPLWISALVSVIIVLIIVTIIILKKRQVNIL
jgi:hypothetical protein